MTNFADYETSPVRSPLSDLTADLSTELPSWASLGGKKRPARQIGKGRIHLLSAYENRNVCFSGLVCYSIFTIRFSCCYCCLAAQEVG